MVTQAYCRFTTYAKPKSGGTLYIPQGLLRDLRFPFNPDDIVRVSIKDSSIVISRAEWFHLVPWTESRRYIDAYLLLPRDIQEKIQKSGLFPELAIYAGN